MSDGPIRRGWQSIPRALRWLLIGLPIAFVTLMLAVNIALWTGLVDRLVSGQHRMAKIELEVGRAWMLWPGTVHVRDFHLDVDAYRYQLHVELPEGEADIALLDLVSRSFHTRSITGDGASVILLLKMAPDRVDQERLDGFPKIADFDPPVRDEELPDIPPLDEAFTVHLEGIDANLTHLTVDEAIFDMATGHLQGSLYAVSGHAFSVTGAQVDVEDASLQLGEDKCVGEAGLQVQLDIAEYDPFSLTGRDVVGQITAVVRAHAAVHDAAAFAMYLPDAAGNVTFGGGKGPLRVEAGLDAGVVQVGSEVTYDTDSLRLYAGEAVVGTPVHLRVAVDEGKKSAISSAYLRMDGMHGGVAGQKGDVVVAKKVEGKIAFAQNDVTSDDWPLHDLLISVPSVKIEKLAALDGVTDAVNLQGGAADLSWKTVRNPDGRFGTDATVDLRDGSFSFDQVRVRGSGKIRVGARTGSQLHQTTIGKLHVELDGVGLDTQRGSSSGTWVRIGGGNVEIGHESGKIDAKIRGRLDDLRPLLAQRSGGLDTALPDLDLTQPLDFVLGIHRKGKSLTLDVDELSRPGLDIRGKVHRTGKSLRYAVLLRGAHIGVYGQKGQKPKVDTLVDDAWLESKFPWVLGKTDTASSHTESDAAARAKAATGGKVPPAYFD